MTKPASFKDFKTSSEMIHLAAMSYDRFLFALRNVEDLLHERGINVGHEIVRCWSRRFGPKFASEVRKYRLAGLKSSLRR